MDRRPELVWLLLAALVAVVACTVVGEVVGTPHVTVAQDDTPRPAERPRAIDPDESTRSEARRIVVAAVDPKVRADRERIRLATFRANPWIEGAVVDRAGDPVPYTHVAWYRHDGEVEREITDEDGSFVFAVIDEDNAGRGFLTALQGYHGVSERIRVGGFESGGEIRLDRELGVIRGQAVYPDGSPARCVPIDASVDETPDGWREWIHGAAHADGITDFEGRFAFRGLARGRWQIYPGDGASSNPERFHELGDESVRIEVTRPCLSVFAYDARTGAALPIEDLEFACWSGDAGAIAAARHARNELPADGDPESVEWFGSATGNWLQAGDFAWGFVQVPGYELEEFSAYCGDGHWDTALRVPMRRLRDDSGIELLYETPPGVGDIEVTVEVMFRRSMFEPYRCSRGEPEFDGVPILPVHRRLSLQPGNYRLSLTAPRSRIPLVPLELDVEVLPGHFSTHRPRFRRGARLCFEFELTSPPQVEASRSGSNTEVLYRFLVDVDRERLRWRNQSNGERAFVDLRHVRDGTRFVSLETFEPGRYSMAIQCSRTPQLERGIELRPGRNYYRVALDRGFHLVDLVRERR